MSDVDTQDRSTTDVKFEEAPQFQAPTVKGRLEGGGSIKAIVPRDFEGAWRMAQIVVAAGMAPKTVNTVEKACVAIMHGMEVGLTPMAALQSIAVINGMPTIWGDGALGLIIASGLLEDMEETSEFDNSGEWQSSTCTMKRKGRTTPIVRMFTRPMAARAGLLKKEGPWMAYPGRMGPMRARAWTQRDGFADVLRGLHIREEVEDMVDVTDQGHASTPEPRKRDFKPKKDAEKKAAPTEVKAQAAEDEGWPLHDEVGETVGRFNNSEWARRVLDASGKLKDKELAAFLENNGDTAKQIYESRETVDALATALQVLYTPDEKAADPVAEKDAPDYWHLGDGVLGEANIIKAIIEMIDGDAVTEPKDVENILKQNNDRIAKMSLFKRQDIESAAEKRHAALKAA